MSKLDKNHKIKKGLLRVLFSRMILVGVSLLIQLAVLATVVVQFGNYFVYFYGFCLFVSIAVSMWLINNDYNPAYKIVWLVLILIFPIFGGIFYLMFGGNRSNADMRAKDSRMVKKTQESLYCAPALYEEIAKEDPYAARQVNYLTQAAGYPLYQHTASRYYSLGERLFSDLIRDLEKAEHYIFLEYFIVEEGLMWDTIRDILAEKARAGVDIRMIYDDIGCVLTLPKHYYRQMNALGIKCRAFNPFIPVLSARLNNRDHRKILVIDGKIAYTGGINLADEYINVYEKYGHWKDNGIRLEGDAVWSFTVMFLTFWDYLTDAVIGDQDYIPFLPHVYHPDEFASDGYVLPYADSPLDTQSIAKNVYLQIINSATKYVYINTPYLVLDYELTTALCMAAQSGVDVRIAVPHIPDKWYVFAVTRANYPTLLRHGVKIYEYTPGFLHAKSFVSDDTTAVVGSINLDYRSLYLHFECAVWLYQTSTVKDIKNDFIHTLTCCQEITMEEYNRTVRWYKRLGYSVLKLFAPLM